MFLHMPRGAQRMYGQLDDVSNLALKYHICTWHLQLHSKLHCSHLVVVPVKSAQWGKEAPAA